MVLVFFSFFLFSPCGVAVVMRAVAESSKGSLGRQARPSCEMRMKSERRRQIWREAGSKMCVLSYRCRALLEYSRRS